MLNKINKQKLAITLLFILTAGLLYTYRSKLSDNNNTKTITPETRTIKQTLELSGSIDAHKKANLHFQTAGLVVYYPWREGDRVKKFQTIASLDQKQLKKTLQQKLNLYAKQRNSFDQTQDDYKKNIDDGDIDKELKRVLENAQYDLNNSVLSVELQDISIRYSRLYSPIDGILIKSPITTPFVNIMPTDTFVVVDPKSLYFSAELEESDLEKLSEGTTVTVVLDAFPEQTIKGTVDRISFTAKETSTGTVYPVDIDISAISEDIQNKLRLSLNGTAYIVTKEKAGVLSLPQSVVHEDENGTFVYIMNNGKKEKRSIETGIEDSEFVEVIKGLSKEDKVVLGE